MANRYSNPSEFLNAIQNVSFGAMALHGRAGRTSATIVQAATIASGIVPSAGRVVSFRMKALESGTTSSTTFNTVGLFRIPSGSITATSIATVRTNRGSNGASAVATPSGATALVAAGDILVMRRLTKLNTASQLYCACEVDREVK